MPAPFALEQAAANGRCVMGILALAAPVHFDVALSTERRHARELGSGHQLSPEERAE
jgi:hypothetical protein